MTDNSVETDDKVAAKPKVFISHRHADEKIATALRKFIDAYSGGRVGVFQSSYSGSGPTIGNALTDDLGQELDESQIVLLVYTIADENWSYCMWETGVAFSPRTQDTRVVVLQCGDDIPAPLGDKASVRASDEESVKAFARQLLTDPKFFPQLGVAVTDWSPDSEPVKDAGLSLWNDLRAVACIEADDSWPAWPLIAFRIELEVVSELKELQERDEEASAKKLVEERTVISDTDEWAARLFGMPRFNKDMSLNDLYQRWLRDNKDENKDKAWYESLVGQILSAASGGFPASSWGFLRHAESERFYAPILTRYCYSSTRRYLQLDVHFPRFDAAKDTPDTIQYDVSRV